MSKASNRNKQRKIRQASRTQQAQRTNRKPRPINTSGSRRSRQANLIRQELTRINTTPPLTARQYRTVRRYKSNQPSRFRVTNYHRQAKLRSVQKAFATMKITNVRITTRNYKKFFDLLDDAKIIGGERRYAEILRIAMEKTNLNDYNGKLFDLVVDNLMRTAYT